MTTQIQFLQRDKIGDGPPPKELKGKKVKQSVSAAAVFRKRPQEKKQHHKPLKATAVWKSSSTTRSPTKTTPKPNGRERDSAKHPLAATFNGEPRTTHALLVLSQTLAQKLHTSIAPTSTRPQPPKSKKRTKPSSTRSAVPPLHLPWTQTQRTTPTPPRPSR